VGETNQLCSRVLIRPAMTKKVRSNFSSVPDRWGAVTPQGPVILALFPLCETRVDKVK
jgi:hypothetical protein